MPGPPWKRRALRALKIFLWAHVVLALAGALGLVLGGQRFLMYHPISGGERSPKDVGIGFEDVRLTTEDGETLRAWFVDAPGTDRTILYCYGNAGNLSNRVRILQVLSELPVDLLFFDYRGYGESSGSPTEDGTYRDARAAWDFLRNDKHRTSADIVVYGRSMGGPIASHLAADVKPAGLVLDSTFESIPRLVQDTYPSFLYVPSLLDYNYPTLRHLAAYAGPVLVAHSPDDTVVPFAHGQALVRRSPRASFLALEGGHGNGPFVTGDAYTQGVRSFVEKIWPELKGTLARR